MHETGRRPSGPTLHIQRNIVLSRVSWSPLARHLTLRASPLPHYFNRTHDWLLVLRPSDRNSPRTPISSKPRVRLATRVRRRETSWNCARQTPGQTLPNLRPEITPRELYRPKHNLHELPSASNISPSLSRGP